MPREIEGFEKDENRFAGFVRGTGERGPDDKIIRESEGWWMGGEWWESAGIFDCW